MQALWGFFELGVSVKVLIKETNKLKSSSSELNRRREKWKSVTQPQIEVKFKKISENAKKLEYPFSLFYHVNDKTINEVTVQLSSGANVTGVVEKIDQPDIKGAICEGEKGSALVASFSSAGVVNFIISPYKSERYARKEKDILLHSGLNPDDVSDKLIEKCIANYLLYSRNSSVYGKYSNTRLDRFKINKMLLVDVRNRKELYQTLWGWFIEVLKITAGGIVGYVVAILTQTP